MLVCANVRDHPQTTVYYEAPYTWKPTVRHTFGYTRDQAYLTLAGSVAKPKLAVCELAVLLVTSFKPNAIYTTNSHPALILAANVGRV